MSSKVALPFPAPRIRFPTEICHPRDPPRLLGPGLSKASKFPTPVSYAEDLNNKLTEVRSTMKFQLKKVLCLAVAVGHGQMSDDQVLGNVTTSMNFSVSLLKNDWRNVKSLHIKSTMGNPIRLF
jgi:large subunit ribosomal protein L10Ae